MQHTRNNIKHISLLEQHYLIHIKGVSHASADLQQARVAERQGHSAQVVLSKFSCPVKIRSEYSQASSPGSGIVLWATFSKNKDEVDMADPIVLGADALGERGVPAEKVGNHAAAMLSAAIESKAPVDAYLADQLLPFMLFVPSVIKTSAISKHCISNIYAIESFFGKTFKIDEKEKSIRTVF